MKSKPKMKFPVVCGMMSMLQRWGVISRGTMDTVLFKITLEPKED